MTKHVGEAAFALDYCTWKEIDCMVGKLENHKGVDTQALIYVVSCNRGSRNSVDFDLSITAVLRHRKSI